MNGILISLVNVLIVIFAIGVAIYTLTKENSARYGAFLFLGGIAIYAIEIYLLISSGECELVSQAVMEALIETSECLGIRGGNPKRDILGLAQVGIIGGLLAMALTPIKRMEERAQAKESNHKP